MKLRSKILLALIFICLAIGSVSSYFLLTTFRETILQEMLMRGQILCNYVAQTGRRALLMEDEVTLGDLAVSVSKNPDVSAVKIVEKSGKIIASSVMGEWQKDYSPPSSSDIKDIKADVVVGGEKIGEVHLWLSLERIEKTIKRTLLVIGSSIGAVLIFSVIFGIIFSNLITQPVNELVKGAYRIAMGDFNVKLTPKTRDEIAVLMKAFNEMAESLKEKAAIKSAMRRYLSPQVAEEILKSEELQRGITEGRRQKVAVMFADIKGFTSMSEKLPPEIVVKILNEYFSIMTKIIFKYNGTLDKFIGDCVMAVFGAPIPQKDASLRAILTAFEIQQKLKKKEIKIGIGINTGEAVVGNIGSEERTDYTVIGDTVNFAQRLQSLANELGEKIIISEAVYKEVKDKIMVKEIVGVKIKGKSELQKVYSVIGVDLKKIGKI